MLTKFNKLAARRRQAQAENLARSARQHACSLRRRKKLLLRLETLIKRHPSIDVQPLQKNRYKAIKICDWQKRQRQQLDTARKLAVRTGTMHP